MFVRALSLLALILTLLTGSQAQVNLKPVKLGKTLFTGTYNRLDGNEVEVTYTETTQPNGASGQAVTLLEKVTLAPGKVKTVPTTVALTIQSVSLLRAGGTDATLQEQYYFAATDASGNDLGQLASSVVYINKGSTTQSGANGVVVSYPIVSAATGFFKYVYMLQITYYPVANGQQLRDIKFLKKK